MESLEKTKTGFFDIIFKNPIRNFVAYPIAAVFMFVVGFQMNSTSFLSLNNQLHYQAGAGIVADSVPESELQEVYNKLGALDKALIQAEKI